jgi:hypothetical protein
MLTSKFVSEDQPNVKLIARASNIAHWFIRNYAENAGCLVSTKNARAEILGALFVGPPSNGDINAHGRASALLNLNMENISGVNHIEFSLINLKRCTSFLLGRGRVSHSIELVRNPLVLESGPRPALAV